MVTILAQETRAHKSDDPLVADQTGHTDPAILSRHYHRVMSASDAAEFWAIVPK